MPYSLAYTSDQLTLSITLGVKIERQPGTYKHSVSQILIENHTFLNIALKPTTVDYNLHPSQIHVIQLQIVQNQTIKQHSNPPKLTNSPGDWSKPQTVNGLERNIPQLR